MQLIALQDNNYEIFCQTLQKTNHTSGIESLIILLPEGNNWSESQINEAIALLSKPVIGGVFPQIINQQQCQTQGAVIVGVAQQLIVNCFTIAEDTEDHIAQQLEAVYPDNYIDDTLLIFTDGLSAGCSVLINQLFEHFGLDINFIGGGAGSLTLVQQPCVITSQGLKQGVAVMALLQQQAGLGVSHGWQPITEAYRVTESNGNRIISLNWQPAFDIYSEVIAQHNGLSINETNFFEIAKAYPFGITKLNSELVVRDPIITEKGDLICVGDVPQGSFVHILTGDITTLPNAATDARKKALGCALFNDALPSWQLFIDCISRVLFLQEHFSVELKNVSINNVPMVGALTLGEIANNGQDYLEFYNKTAVVAVFQD